MIFTQAGFYQSIISATWALGFLKISIAFNLLRLSTHKWFRWSLWATIGTACVPLAAPFATSNQLGQCLSAATPSWE